MEPDEASLSAQYRLESPTLERKTDGGNGYTTPRSIKTEKHLQKLQDAPSLTNSLDFTGTNDCTPKRQKKCRGRDCTPELADREPAPDPAACALQSAFTSLLSQSETMKKSSFQLLSQSGESAAREAMRRLDLVSAEAYSSARSATADMEKSVRDRQYQVSQMMVRLYFFTFNQRSETLAKLFVKPSLRQRRSLSVLLRS